MTDRPVIFSGASITNSPWDSWKDFVKFRYGIKNFIDNDYKGVGNEFIVESTIVQCKKNPKALALVMLTNFDKWDWYVDDIDLANKINRNEKHPVRDLQGNISYKGYWSTGSWFPTYKETYHQNYYSDHYFIKNSLKNLYVLQKFFSDADVKHLILFDSPIFECAEQVLNTGKLVKCTMFQQDEELKQWSSMIDWREIYQPGLIGFCEENGLDWYNTRYKGHPPSSSHFYFAEKHIFPCLDNILPIVENDQSWKLSKMDRLWKD